MSLTEPMTFAEAFLAIFAGYRTSPGHPFLAKDLDRAQQEATAFMDRLAEIEKAGEKKGK